MAAETESNGDRAVDRRLRVQVVTTWFPSDAHPTEAPFNLKHVEAIALAHDIEVMHVRLGSTMPDIDELYQGFIVKRRAISPRHPVQTLRTLRDVRSAVRGAEIVHSMAFSSALVCALASIFLRPAWVHTEHWNGVVNPASVSKTWRVAAWLRRVLARPDWLTGVTEQLTSVLARYGSAQRSSTVPCVVENPLPVVERGESERLELIAVGGLIERKNPIIAVRTLRWLLDRGVTARMTWVGDGALRATVEAEVKRLELTDSFRITGFVEPDDVFGYLVDADQFFLPTSQENFFTSAAEALSAGRPVVAPRGDGYADYVDETNSVLVDGFDPADFGRAIELARERFSGTAASAIADPIRKRFSMGQIGAAFDGIYRTVLTQSDASA